MRSASAILLLVAQSAAGWRIERALASLSGLAAAGFGAAALAALAGHRLPAVEAVEAPADAPLLSVVVPARNEARDVARTLQALAAQRYPRLEVVAVDDRSEDATAAAIEAAAAGDDRILAVRGAPPPPGWLGKPWALDQGVRRARGEWLC